MTLVTYGPTVFPNATGSPVALPAAFSIVRGPAGGLVVRSGGGVVTAAANTAAGLTVALNTTDPTTSGPSKFRVTLTGRCSSVGVGGDNEAGGFVFRSNADATTCLILYLRSTGLTRVCLARYEGGSGPFTLTEVLDSSLAEGADIDITGTYDIELAPLSGGREAISVTNVSTGTVVLTHPGGDSNFTMNTVGRHGPAVLRNTSTVAPALARISGLTITDVDDAAGPEVLSVTVTPNPASVAVGSTRQLTADVVVTGGAAQTVTWESSNETVATVNSSGLVTGLLAGSATITARSTADTGVTGSTSLSVTPAVTGATTQQFTATPKDGPGGTGNTLTGRLIQWSSSNPPVATVDSTGLATTQGASGQAVITAVCEGVVNTATITVP